MDAVASAEFQAMSAEPQAAAEGDLGRASFPERDTVEGGREGRREGGRRERERSRTRGGASAIFDIFC